MDDPRDDLRRLQGPRRLPRLTAISAAAARPQEVDGGRVLDVHPSSLSGAGGGRDVDGVFMYAVIGITGQVGCAIARKLLADKRRVRAVLRDANRGLPWAGRRCGVARADLQDTARQTDA